MRLLDKDKLEITLNDRILTDIAENNIFGAAVYVGQAGKTLYRNSMGVADPATGAPVTERTLFRIASMTKPITAVATMILTERGKLSLDDPIERYYPQFKNMKIAEVGEGDVLRDAGNAKTKITIRNILSHTSGIGSGRAGALQIAAMTTEDMDTLGNTIDFFSRQGLSFEPGTKQEYSGFPAYDVLTGILEKTADEDYGSFLYREIFSRCNMEDTTFVPAQSQWGRLAAMHDRVSGKSCVSSMHPGCVFEKIPCTHALGGAGLVSTLSDYSNFAEMLLNGGVYFGEHILSQASVNELATPQLPASIQPGLQRWGLGVRVIVDGNYPGLPVGSFGWSGAYGPHFWIDPENQIAAVYMKNSRHDPGAGSVTGYHFEADVYNSMK